MGVVKITFDGSSVSASQDAIANHFICGCLPDGIMRNLADGLTYTVSNNYITFQSGYVQVYGRRVYVEGGSQVYVALDSTKYGYVILDFNLTTNSVTLTKIESAGSYPSLIRTDLFRGGTRYQFPIAKYMKTTSAITLQPFERAYLDNPLDVAESGYDKAVDYMRSNYISRYMRVPSASTATSTSWDLSNFSIGKVLVTICIEGNCLVTAPGNFFAGHSTGAIQYRYSGTDYMLTCEWTPSHMLILNTGSSDRRVDYICVYQMGV